MRLALSWRLWWAITAPSGDNEVHFAYNNLESDDGTREKAKKNFEKR